MSIWSERKWLISFQILPFVFLLLMVTNFLKINKDQEADKKYALMASDIYHAIQKISLIIPSAISRDEDADYQQLSILRTEVEQKLNLLILNSQNKFRFSSLFRKNQKEILEQFSVKWKKFSSVLSTIENNRNNSLSIVKMKDKFKVVFEEINKSLLNIIKTIDDKNTNFSTIMEVLSQIELTRTLAIRFGAALDITAADMAYKGTPYDNIESYFEKFEGIRRNISQAPLLPFLDDIFKNFNVIRENKNNILALLHWANDLKEAEKSINQDTLLLLTLATSIEYSYYYLGNTWLDSTSTYILGILILSSILFLLYVLHQRRIQQLISGKDLEISHVLTYINSLTSSLETVCQHALESASIASESVVIANEGGRALRDTIHGMEDVQEEIQGTSNSILLLNKGSQEIEDIVSLIDAIADQTNILSLNASIQAAMAGEAGRGFGVVADEVQRLAIKASYATRQIASLVKNIQTNTTNVMSAMQQTKSDVLRGTTLVKDAGLALEKIQNIARHLSSSIENISVLIQEQTERSKKLTST